MSESIAERNGLTAYVEQEEYLENPREEWDHAGHMICWHRRYDLGDKKLTREFPTPEDFQEWWEQNGKGGLCFGLSLLDHSGLHMYMGHGAHWSDAQGWDSGPIGYIYITRAEIQKEWGKSKGNTARARKCLEAEVTEYDQYLTGDVWYVCIKDKEGEVVDSCGMFYGYDYACQEAKSMLATCSDSKRDKDGQQRFEAQESYR